MMFKVRGNAGKLGRIKIKKFTVNSQKNYVILVLYGLHSQF